MWIEIRNKLYNSDNIDFIEPEGLFHTFSIVLHFKSGRVISIDWDNKDARDMEFNNLNQGLLYGEEEEEE